MTIVAGHLTYGLIALSYLLRDILWLRAVALAASVFAIVYNYLAPAEPLWIPIGWNVLFVAINVYHVLQLRRSGQQGLHAEEIDLAQTFLLGASPPQLSELFQCGHWRDLMVGDVLAREGDFPGHVAVLYEGEVAVLLDGRPRGRIDQRTFIGEISFLTGEPATATVVVTTPSRALIWPAQALQKLLDQDQQLNAQFQNWLALDLTRKLTRSDEKETQPELLGAS